MPKRASEMQRCGVDRDHLVHLHNAGRGVGEILEFEGFDSAAASTLVIVVLQAVDRAIPAFRLFIPAITQCPDFIFVHAQVGG